MSDPLGFAGTRVSKQVFDKQGLTSDLFKRFATPLVSPRTGGVPRGTVFRNRRRDEFGNPLQPPVEASPHLRGQGLAQNQGIRTNLPPLPGVPNRGPAGGGAGGAPQKPATFDFNMKGVPFGPGQELGFGDGPQGPSQAPQALNFGNAGGGQGQQISGLMALLQRLLGGG